MRSDRVRQLFAALLSACLAASPAAAEPVPEHDMKAAFVFNFAVFTQWPHDTLAANTPISVCANPASPMFGALRSLGDKLVNGHRISVRESVAPLRGCHVLVLDRSDREHWVQWKRDLAGAAVLTVADDQAIGSDGAIIALSVKDKRIGFDIYLAPARNARLNLSSKLLRLARSVQ